VYNTWLLILSDTLILRRTKADEVSINGELRSLVALPEKNKNTLGNNPQPSTSQATMSK